MRLFLISLAVLLLAAGCAGSRAVDPEVAPSRQASLNDPNSGWSVPPGQTEVSDPQPQASAGEPQAAAQEQPDEAAIAEAERREREEAARKARERLRREREQERQREVVQPLVPAFPARVQEDRVLTLQTVHFGFDQWDLTPEARAALNSNAAWLKANPEVTVRVEGHADERGTAEYNLALGERRAKRVREYLIERGVPADNLVTVSYGEEMPVDHASNEQAWSLNRRAEFSRAGNRQVSDATGPSHMRR